MGRRYSGDDGRVFELLKETMQKIIFIEEMATPEQKEQLQKKKKSINKVFKEIKEKLRTVLGGTMPTASALEASKILRDGSTFQWYVIALFALVVYVYAVEVERKNWNLFFGGLAFWGMDWFNEIWNGLVFHLTHYAPVWGAPGKTAYLILIGLNIEICFMFAVAGITFAKMLPADKHLRIMGVPNRLLFAGLNSAFCVFVEVLLNSVGALTWDYNWWGAGTSWLIFLIGYLPFFLVSFWVHDMESVGRKALTVGVILGIDLLALLVFGVSLKWI